MATGDIDSGFNSIPGCFYYFSYEWDDRVFILVIDQSFEMQGYVSCSKKHDIPGS